MLMYVPVYVVSVFDVHIFFISLLLKILFFDCDSYRKVKYGREFRVCLFRRALSKILIPLVLIVQRWPGQDH